VRTQGIGGRIWVTLASIAVIVAACSGSGGGTTSAPASAAASASAASAGDPTSDKLAQVKARGTLVLWTDPDYAPQSMKVEGAARAADTKCGPNEMTGPEMTGYDAETGKAVAAELGVEPCFVVTPFDAMIAGSWGDRYDVAWGSGAITTDRMKRLYVTQPYYSTPASFFVKDDSTITKPTELSGKKIGVCSGCTHHSYLDRSLELPGTKIDFVVDKPEIVTFNTEIPGLEATAAGKLDAFLCSEPVGLAAIAKGQHLKELATPAYFTNKTGYVDRDLTLAPGPFLAAVDKAVQDLHASGKLKELSLKFFEHDYATQAAAFDLGTLDQSGS
jgi:polar amino acid transport system substrate-binding protein